MPIFIPLLFSLYFTTSSSLFQHYCDITLFLYLLLYLAIYFVTLDFSRNSRTQTLDSRREAIVDGGDTATAPVAHKVTPDQRLQLLDSQAF